MLDFDDLEEAEETQHAEDAQQATEGRQGDAGAPQEPALGSRWRPRCGPPPSPEAPYAPSLLDLSGEELARVPRCIYSLKPLMNAKRFKEVVDTQAPGAHYGMLFPHSFELLRQAGPAWLTQAFHAAGTLPVDNRVVSMTVHELSTEDRASESTGATGLKGWLEVAYDRPHEGLHTELFVKLPFPYSPSNDRQKNSLTFTPDESEILFNRLFGPMLPFRIPKYYFGDFSYESTNFILISERVPYKATSWRDGGRELPLAPLEVEPPILKFRDYEVPEDGFQQYRATMRALGRMVAEYHNGGLGNLDHLRYLFPREPPTPFEGIGWEAAQAVFAQNGGKLTQDPGFEAALEQQNAQALSVQSAFAFVEVAFVRNAPQLFPKELGEARFLKQWYRELMEVVFYTAEITFYLHVDPAFISLVHTNLTPDNAWYWRSEEGELQCGLLDFGATALQNVALNMLASWTAAEPPMLKRHAPELLQAFADGCRESGGPASASFEELQTCVLLAMAVNNAGVGSNAMQLLRMKPKEEWAQMESRWDPRVNDDMVFRNYVCAIATMLSLWRDQRLYAAFKAWRRKNEHWMPKKKRFVCPPMPSELQ